MTSPNAPMVEWLRYPEAEAYVSAKLDQYVTHVPLARDLQADLILHTGSRLVDWLDHLIMADGDQPCGELKDLGFEIEEVEVEPGDTVFYHPGALFPRMVVRTRAGAEPGDVIGAALHVEDINEFLMVRRLSAPVEGTSLSPYRRARIWQGNERELSVVERRGHPGMVPVQMPLNYAQRYLHAYERWLARPRDFGDLREGMDYTLSLARLLVSEMGTDQAAWLAFAAERAYWQRRNKAGQVQRARQEKLGVGWANHDHHTFRSSREVFGQLIQILETFGFRPRERFYAGAEAGWGAQVMEQPVCRFAVFADVDLAPDEVAGDFAHQPLQPREELGTVGLWCALHGDSMVGAGLHHLACRFDFDTATAGLAEWGIHMMEPFSKFSYLRQAFTTGERWEISEERLRRLLSKGRIDEAQLKRFEEQGAVGSHLENIQRGDGFKGFNQQTISDIMRRTDPRRETGAA
jgi:hypothetical protein